MHNFWAQNGPFPQMRIFSENLLMNFASFINAYLHTKKESQWNIREILTIKEYWNLIRQEPFLAITWEPDFSQACSFRRMLMNHNNFHFTQIPDKTNFWPFLVIFAQCGFFPKNPALSRKTRYEPLTPC